MPNGADPGCRTAGPSGCVSVGHGLIELELWRWLRIGGIESGRLIESELVSVEGVGAEPGKVDIFDLRTFERVADVRVAQQAGGIAFWKMNPSR